MKITNNTKLFNKRIELIDEELGKQYVNYNSDVEFSFQDDGRTIKIFVTPKEDSDVVKEMSEGLISSKGFGDLK